MIVSYNIILYTAVLKKLQFLFLLFGVPKFDNTQPPSKEASPGQKGLVSKFGKSFVLSKYRSSLWSVGRFGVSLLDQIKERTTAIFVLILVW